MGGTSDGAASLEAWVLASLPRAAAFARSLLRDRAAADDVVQDCYCRVIAHAAGYDLPRDGTRILFRAIANACVDRARRARRCPGPAGAEEGEPERVDRRTPDPADAAAGRELEAALDAALAALPAPQRAAVEMKALGYSLAEIADAVGVTSAHAAVLIHRGRAALARHLPRVQDDEA